MAVKNLTHKIVKVRGMLHKDMLINTIMGRITIAVIVLSLLLAACARTSQPNPALMTSAPTENAPMVAEIILATTTSTQDSGLLDVLIPLFERQSPYRVKTIAVGSGQALQMGRDGNADMLLVHSPAAEKAFMEAGYGLDRRPVMHNDFILLGPASDPAGAAQADNVAEALRRIASTGSLFYSRGDDSGTHKMELNLWQKAAIQPAGDWYQETGQGMGATLKIASERQAYTLSDRGTYLANRQQLELIIVFEGDPALLNVYHVITVNPAGHPAVNLEGARAFAEFLVSAETQAIIGQFGVERFGQPLFFPDANKKEEELGVP